jgi:hypothetical protein
VIGFIETMSSGLTFDWDDTDISNPKVLKALSVLCTEFGPRVWVRTSSSGTGLHVLIGELTYDTLFGIVMCPVPMDLATQMMWRKVFSEKPWNLECVGRLFSDQVRSAEGFRTSRVFKSKNGMTSASWISAETLDLPIVGELHEEE